MMGTASLAWLIAVQYVCYTSSSPSRDNSAEERARAEAAATERLRAEAAVAERLRAEAAVAERLRAETAAEQARIYADAVERDRKLSSLRFEYEKRQRTIPTLQIKIITLEHALEQQKICYGRCIADLGEDDSDAFRAQTDIYNRASNMLSDEIRARKNDVLEAERDMADIQRNLDKY